MLTLRIRFSRTSASNNATTSASGFGPRSRLFCSATDSSRTLTVPFARLPGEADLAGTLAGAGFQVVALSPRGEVELDDLACGPRMAPLFGAEGPGLAPELLARVTSVRIAMAPGFDSLNVATTSALVLHRLLKAGLRPG